jgi:ribose transport system permease protein
MSTSELPEVTEPAAPSDLGDTEAPPRPYDWKRLIRPRGRRELSMLVIDGLFIFGVSRFTPYFATYENFKVLILGMAMEAIVLAAMTWLLVSGMFDLSVDGVVNMSGVIAGGLITASYDYRLAILVAVAAAAAVGLANGLAVTKIRMDPLMTTLGTWWVTQGIAYGLTSGYPTTSYPSAFLNIGGASPLGIDMPIWYMIVLVPILGFILAKTRFGYHLYATGGSREAARLHGVRVNRVTIVAFVVVALTAGLTGVVYASQLNTAAPNVVNGLNLRVIGGAVIGGTSLYGGIGTVPGAFLGLLFMDMITNASTVLGVSPYWQYALLGGVLLLAVAADAMAGRRERQQ